MSYLKVVLVLCTLNALVYSDNEGSWGYRNDRESQSNVLPTDWHTHHSKCYGQRQSPINVIFSKTTFDKALKPIQINELDGSAGEEWNMVNNGATVKLTSNKNYVFNMGSETFKFLQMHFHWRGSEHQVDGQLFAGELHLVHQSMNNSGSYAVVGFLIQLVEKDNLDFNPIMEHLKEVRDFKAKTTLNKLKLNRLVSLQVDNYYRYPGSLTTPGCDEVVEWILVDRPIIGLSEKQVLEFQALRDKEGHNILTNSRPVQNINQRSVRRSFYPAENSRYLNSASGFENSSVRTESSKWISIVYTFLVFLTVLSF